ncbi:phosphoribosylaminoimidazolesuccinocarboxamide synthase [Mesorhizobium sp. M0488]|uniref:phosphoribosylaminoimidazolesuccinocarboxamide synthase n=1 Tax=unclassified Mesorhizobium TaxID=325217 RepID=UPI00333767FE
MSSYCLNGNGRRTIPKRWSTKDLRVVEAPKPGRSGRGAFVFTDDYSVFHFSKMPDQIPDKGEVIARMAVATLREAAKAGVPTHLIAFDPPRSINVRLLNVLDPARDELHEGDRARLVPLQVIYRNMLPPGASVYRRLAAGNVTLEELGLKTLPEANTWLEQPIIEFTTKLEEIDRFIPADEAREIARLDAGDFAMVRELTLHTNAVVCGLAARSGLICADGKVEFGIDDDGRIMLVDVAGTPDENRFLLAGRHVSKQPLRDYYLTHDLERQVQQLVAAGVPREKWARPERLPANLLAAVAEMYRALCESWTGETVWGARPLDETVEEVDRVLIRHLAAA